MPNGVQSKIRGQSRTLEKSGKAQTVGCTGHNLGFTRVRHERKYGHLHCTTTIARDGGGKMVQPAIHANRMQTYIVDMVGDSRRCWDIRDITQLDQDQLLRGKTVENYLLQVVRSPIRGCKFGT